MSFIIDAKEERDLVSQGAIDRKGLRPVSKEPEVSDEQKQTARLGTIISKLDQLIEVLSAKSEPKNEDAKILAALTQINGSMKSLVNKPAEPKAEFVPIKGFKIIRDKNGDANYVEVER